MRGTRNIDDLLRYVYKVYKEPKRWWSKAHYEKRCTQIYAAEVVLQRCLDSPFSDPADIIEEYLMEIYSSIKRNDNKQSAKILNIIEETLENLLRYLS